MYAQCAGPPSIEAAPQLIVLSKRAPALNVCICLLLHGGKPFGHYINGVHCSDSYMITSCSLMTLWYWYPTCRTGFIIYMYHFSWCSLITQYVMFFLVLQLWVLIYTLSNIIYDVRFCKTWYLQRINVHYYVYNAIQSRSSTTTFVSTPMQNALTKYESPSDLNQEL